jgi:hypothetical protein
MEGGAGQRRELGGAGGQGWGLRQGSGRASGGGHYVRRLEEGRAGEWGWQRWRGQASMAWHVDLLEI